MSQEIESVDTSTIEDLQKLRKEVEVLQGRLSTMEERRDSVSEAVYERVAADYQTQLDALAEEAAPLKERAREEYGRLRVMYEELEKAQSDAALAKEEIEFRHELGEFEEKDYAKLSKEHEERVQTCEDELAAAGVVRQSFIDAFGSEEELESPTESTEEVEQIDDTEDAAEASDEDDDAAAGDDEEGEAAGQDDPSDDSDEFESIGEGQDPAGTMAIPEGGGVDGDRPITEATEITEIPSADEAETADEETEDNDGASEGEDWSTAATNVFERPLVSEAEAPPPPPFAPAPGAVPEAVQSEATRILPKPRLVTLEGGEPVSTYVLGPTVVTLGRATDNSIRLTEEAVSRHHAEVIPGPDGFLLRDQGSENGTYVNGKRKKEHLLVEGDIIQIGVRKLRFHDA